MLSGHDHSKEGSGNPGATNVWRTSGKALGVLTLVVDLLKGALPVIVALLVAGRPWAAATWAAATIGHVIPIGRWRSGGKGVATAGGGALVLYPLISVLLIAVFLVVVKVTKRVSVGSLMMAALVAVGAVFTHEFVIEVAAAVLVAAVIFIRHRSNIGRLISGQELTLS